MYKKFHFSHAEEWSDWDLYPIIVRLQYTVFILSFIVAVYSSRSVTSSQESSIFAQFIMNQLRGLSVITYYIKLVLYV